MKKYIIILLLLVSSSLFAQGITPAPYSRPYKVYTALLTQTDTLPPVATVLENTIGDIVFGYGSPGSYTINLIGGFTEGKTYFYTLYYVNENEEGYLTISRNSADLITITCVNIETAGQNNALYNTPIEIRVYQ